MSNNNQVILDNFIVKSNSFGEDIKRLQEIFVTIRKKKEDIAQREKLLAKDKEDTTIEESGFHTNFFAILHNLYEFQKETFSVINEMYKKSSNETNFLIQTFASQWALAESAHKSLTEATQRYKAEAEFQAQTEAIQRRFIEQTLKAQSEIMDHLQINSPVPPPTSPAAPPISVPPMSATRNVQIFDVQKTALNKTSFQQQPPKKKEEDIFDIDSISTKDKKKNKPLF